MRKKTQSCTLQGQSSRDVVCEESVAQLCPLTRLQKSPRHNGGRITVVNPGMAGCKPAKLVAL